LRHNDTCKVEATTCPIRFDRWIGGDWAIAIGVPSYVAILSVFTGARETKPIRHYPITERKPSQSRFAWAL
jgi:hypothetical protein